MVRAHKELSPPPGGEKGEEGLEEIVPLDEVEAQLGGDTTAQKIEARRRAIVGGARLITEGLGSIEDMPPEIAERAREEVARQTDALVDKVLENVVAADETGVLRDALARAEEILGKERKALSPTEQLRTTLTTRLEFLAARGESKDPEKMDAFVKGMEKAGKGALERLAELRKQKRPPSRGVGGQSPEARA